MLQISFRLAQLIVVPSWENGKDLEGSVCSSAVENAFSMSFIEDALTVRVSKKLCSR